MNPARSRDGFYTTGNSTCMLPLRVALEYGHTWCASSTILSLGTACRKNHCANGTIHFCLLSSFFPVTGSSLNPLRARVHIQRLMREDDGSSTCVETLTGCLMVDSPFPTFCDGQPDLESSGLSNTKMVIAISASMSISEKIRKIFAFTKASSFMKTSGLL